MTYIEIDVDLDEFSLSEILEELEDRYNCKHKKDKAAIDEWIKDLIDYDIITSHANTTLLDKMKIEFFMNNIGKINLSDLENLV
jgi:hypothetical protein